MLPGSPVHSLVLWLTSAFFWQIWSEYGSIQMYLLLRWFESFFDNNVQSNLQMTLFDG